MIPVKRIYLLYLQTVLIIAGPASQYRMGNVVYTNALIIWQAFLGSEGPVQVFCSSDESKQEICKAVRYISLLRSRF